MKKNMGTADRIIRIIVALVLGYLYFTNVITGTWGLGLLILACVFVLTSLIGFCPAYLPFGLKTICKKK
jgi:small-conductance mechanosensitive channel